MAPFACMIFLACCVATACHYWKELHLPDDTKASRRFWAWALKGIALPLVLWVMFNLGIVATLPPLWPNLHHVQAVSGSWLWALITLTLVAAFMIGSYWAATTFGWLLTTIALRTQSREDFLGFSVFLSLLLVPVAAVLTYYGGFAWLGLAICLWLVPIIHFTCADARIRKLPPMYSRAIAKLKFGKDTEAEAEVIRELEKHEDDFEGWMMLADMYATRFKDLSQADQVVRDLCNQPNITSVQISLALHRLADWHLKLGNDPEAACRALVELCHKLPNTHFSRMAQKRISQLPMTRADLLDQREKTFRIPVADPSFNDPSEEKSKPELSVVDALALASDYTERLKEDPNDVPAREAFAAVLAEHLAKIDLAIEQLELLIAMPEQPDKKIAEWLCLMATWLLRYRHDEEAAVKVMERLVHEYPQTPQAFAAQKRLNLLELERRFRRAATKHVAPTGAGA